MDAQKRFASITLMAVLFAGVTLCMDTRDSYAYVHVKGEMNFIQIDPVKFELRKSSHHYKYKTAENRLWYTYFQADENYTSKPLFVFLNGGPGCGTSMNLFAMNTAPYTLDRSRVPAGQLSAVNENSWTELGNLLYIDAPNTGFSYMLYKTDPEKGNDWEIYKYFHTLKPFVYGDNYNSFIDADQVLRCLFKFLDNHEDIAKNEIILVGESYSGVRVTTMLNLLLRYKKYSEGTDLVYKDPDFSKVVEAHFQKALKKDGPYSVADITKQFKRQILIQPQIVDTYQGEDAKKAFLAPNSLMDRIAQIGDRKVNEKWRDYVKKTKDPSAASYLLSIERDQYNCSKSSDWSNENEYFAIQSLLDVNELARITGSNPLNIDGFKPENRKRALKFPLPKDVPFAASLFLKTLKIQLSQEKQFFVDMIPYWPKDGDDMYDRSNTFEMKMGELNSYDDYLTGTNVYAFLGFMTNGGGNYPHQIYSAAKHDPFDISAGMSTRYGKMFLENVTNIDTFMTHAPYDVVVYSPALATQFDHNRFCGIVNHMEYTKDWPVAGTDKSGDKPGHITFHFNTNALKDFNAPESRIVDWYYYGTSGHSVSSTQPEKFKNDVKNWLAAKNKQNKQ